MKLKKELEETLVNKILLFILIIFLLTSCSLNSKSSFWTKEKKIEQENKKIKIYKVNEKKTQIIKEFNENLEIKLNGAIANNSFINNLDNNNGIINYNGNLIKSSKYKFSKIKNFKNLEPELIFHNNGIIFFDNKGTILHFGNNSKLIWKKNIYTKKEKKLNPVLFFASTEKTLIVNDSIGKYYALDIENGNILWKKNHSSPFNSQIKIYRDKFFTVDFESTLNCFSLIDGKKLWKIKTEETFIKSIKKLSLIIKNNFVIFNNSIGDISAVNINEAKLVWQTPTQSTNIYADSFKLKISHLVSDSGSVYFSNNKNEFYSLDLENGLVNWKQNINSTVRPTVIGKLLFTVSSEGFLVVMDKVSGNIVRVTDMFGNFKKREIIKPEGFIIGSETLYLTTNNGKLLLINILNGKVNKILNIDKEKISRPKALNSSLYITKNGTIIKLN